MTPTELVALYLRLGFRLLYWERKGTEWKGPREKGWNDPQRVYDLSLYDPALHNLGVFTGHEIEPGKFLTDVDYDWAPGIAFATKFFPPTSLGLKREGKPLSHAFFTTPTRVGVIKYLDIGTDPATLLEIRGGDSTHETMIAPSLHTAPGIFIELLGQGPIGHVPTQELLDPGLDFAIACLFIKNLPKKIFAHDARLAFAGFLLRAGLSEERVTRIAQVIAGTTGNNVEDVKLTVESTVSRLANKDKKAAGGPKLAQLLGDVGPALVAQVRSWLGVSTDALILNPAAPLDSARVFVERAYTVGESLALYHQNGVFYRFLTTHYREHDEPAVRAETWKFLDTARAWSQGKEPQLVPYQPNTTKVSNTLDALRGVCNLPMVMASPCWLNGHANSSLNPLDVVACENGLLHIPTRTLHPATPDFFTLNGLNFPFEPAPPPPVKWLAFLNDLWDEDPEAISTLQEIFGYLLTPDTRFQKIFMLIGPKRSGKSLIGRILAKMIGEQNLCSPTLSSLAGNFGKQPLVGKSLALVADARISGRTDTSVIAETLLAISGEDPQTIERKYLPAWNGKLPTRFVVITNELPRIGDMSGALTSRFIILMLTKSFYGRENLGLYDSIEPEMSGILHWALEGRDRLYARRYFVQPKSSEDMLQEFADLSSPSQAFFRVAVEGPVAGAWVSTEDLFTLWKLWCANNGVEHAGTAQNFGKSVRAGITYVTMKQVGGRGEQKKVWGNIRLTEEWAQKIEQGPQGAQEGPLTREM